MNVNNILAVPLSVPRIEPDSWGEFWSVWNRDKNLYKRLKADSAGNNHPVPHWEGFVWEWSDTKQNMFNVVSENYDAIFPKLKQQLIDYFPFEIKRILFQSNVISIPLHQDGSVFTDHLDYPASIRVMLYDENIQPTFFLARGETSEKIYMNLADTTNSFVYNNPKVYHGADYYNKTKILMHIISYDFDEVKWFDLLEKSCNEYKDTMLIAPGENTWI